MYTKIDLNNFVAMLEYSKNINTNILLIPRLPFQLDPHSSICGINNDSIVVTMNSSYLSNNLTYLWDQESIPIIAFNSVQINPFLKAIKDGIITELKLVYDIYSEEDKFKSKATFITTNNPDYYLVLNSPFMYLEKIDKTFSNYNFGTIVYQTKLENNEKFNEIRAMKASDGMVPFYIENAKEYIIYLTKTMFSIKNKDNITLTITDDISLKDSYNGFFIANIEIIRESKTQFGKEILRMNYCMNFLKLMNG